LCESLLTELLSKNICCW